MILWGSCFNTESARHSLGHRKSDWQTANIDRTVFEISCFMEKFDGYYGPVGWRLDAPMVQKNFGWLSKQWDVSVNSRVLEVAYNELIVYLGNIIAFWSLWWSWRIGR